MEALFLKIWYMSMMAGIAALAVLLLRQLLKRAPKGFTCLLWIIVFVRLLCPVTISLGIGLIPDISASAMTEQGKTENIVPDGLGGVQWESFKTEGQQRVQDPGTGDGAKNKSNPSESGTSAQKWIHMASVLWLSGVVVFFTITVVQDAALRKKLETAVLVSTQAGNNCAVYETDRIQTPFLYGIRHPRIYLPLGIGDDKELVISHEQMHKRHMDHILKPVCYFALILHWFNPLAWISYFVFTKDVEMFCDESVLSASKLDIRQDYSREILQLAVEKGTCFIPPAFGESNVKDRIKNVLQYKKPSVWTGMAAIIIVFAAAVTLLTNSNQQLGAGSNSSSGEISSKELEVQLCEYRIPYLGNNWAVGRLKDLLLLPDGFRWDGMEILISDGNNELLLKCVKQNGTIAEEEVSETPFALTDPYFYDMVYLFATIENMDVCTFELPVPRDEGTFRASYNRKDVEDLFGPLYPRSELPDDMRQLTKEIEKYLTGAGKEERKGNTPESEVSAEKEPASEKNTD